MNLKIVVGLVEVKSFKLTNKRRRSEFDIQGDIKYSGLIESKEISMSSIKLTTKLVLIYWLVSTTMVFGEPELLGNEAKECQKLANLRINDTNLLSASMVVETDDLPAYCRVFGYIRPAIHFEVRLPIINWNQKFFMAGCGAYCGSIEESMKATESALKRNYAVSSMDSGHWSEKQFDDPIWAFNNRQAEIDYGYRAVHETAKLTKKIIKSFYDKKASESYFQGCSNGGRQGIMEALRYPNDFTGIISEGPHPKLTGTYLLEIWLTQINSDDDGNNIITPKEVALIQQKVKQVCDPADGLKDGLISDPTNCPFKPSSLLCKENKEQCLNSKQVSVLDKMYGGPKDSSGKQLYSGLPMGSEEFWVGWVVGRSESSSDDFSRKLARGFLRYMAFAEDPGEAYKVEDFNFDTDPKKLEAMAKIYDVDNADLLEYKEAGGKLLMLHSWADAAPPPQETVAYYQAVEKRIGDRKDTQDFFRLFMIPGMGHCGIGTGLGIGKGGFDALSSLETWAEKDIAPESITTTKKDKSGKVLWTQPICPYPQRAEYKGKGSIKKARNYECR